MRFGGGILDRLDEAALAVLFDVGSREQLTSGTRIVREGEGGGDVWVLLSGSCDVDVGGDRIATLGPGQLFGEIAALTGGTRTASVTSVGPCELLRLTPDALASAMARSTGLMNHLLVTLAARSRTMTSREDAVRREHRELARLEEAMLPNPEVFATSRRYSHEVFWRPLTYASGDYCDVVPLGDDRYLVALGDVLGHGAPTSLAIGAARGQMRELAVAGVPPGAALRRLDQHLFLHGPPGMHVTLVLALLDGHTATIATAGHPPPLRWHGGGAASVDIEPGPLLGYGLSRGDYGEVDVELEKDDKLLFYTDGVVELRVPESPDEDGLLGEEGVRRLFAEACAADDGGSVMDAFVYRLGALADTFISKDDMAMLLLHVLA